MFVWTECTRTSTSIHRFERRLTAIGKELESDDYANLPARQWHRGYGDEKPTVQARVRRLSVARPRKPARLLVPEENITDRV